MNTFRFPLLVGLLFGGLSLSGLAMADHDHGHHGWSHGGIGVYLGPWWGYPGYVPRPYYPYYYPPQVITVPAAPPVYIQQAPQDVERTAPPGSYWYYCRNPQGYYPYVRQCPGGWQAVAPQPPDLPQER